MPTPNDERVRVFLSYRRGDAAGHTGRLHDDLTDRLGRQNVFQDVEAIGPGERFAETIDRTIAQCDVVLALIGRRWLEADPDTGRARLHNETDVMRRELETALGGDSKVIPVLVDRATLPAPGELPESLRPLLDLNAIEIRDAAWSQDLATLYEAIGIPERRRRPQWQLPVAALLGASVLVLAFLVYRQFDDPGTSESSSSSPRATFPAGAGEPLPPETTVRTTRKTGEVEWTLQQWWQVPAGGQTAVVLRVKVTNRTVGDEFSTYPELFHLYVDDVDVDTPTVTAAGVTANPDPGEAAILKVEFASVPPGEVLRLEFDYDFDKTPLPLRS